MKRLARLLLLLYPHEFRRRLGEEALRHLEGDLDESADRRGLDRVRGHGRAWLDFALHGVLARIDALASVTDGFWIGGAQDLRLALRSSIRRPAFALVSVASVAIGVGVNATMFSIADTLFLRSIPGAGDPARIVEVGSTTLGSPRLGPWSYPDFLDLRAEAPLAVAALYDTQPVALSDEDGGEQVMAMFVTSGYFETLGVELEMGRTFDRSEEIGPGAHPLAILSYRTWMDRFGGDPAIVGKAIRVNREEHTIVGVAPARFRGHHFGLYPALYLPLSQHAGIRTDPDRFLGSRNTSWASVLARLDTDTDLTGLNAALETIFARVAAAHPGRTATGARAPHRPAWHRPTPDR